MIRIIEKYNKYAKLELIECRPIMKSFIQSLLILQMIKSSIILIVIFTGKRLRKKYTLNTKFGYIK